MCYIFNDDEERHQLIAKFIESGLLGHEKVTYLGSSFADKPVDDVLRRFGVGPLPEIKAGQFQALPADDVYCPGHVFLPERMLDRLCKHYSDSIAEGYAGARMSGEMEWALKGIPGSEHLIEYEARINTIHGEHPVTPICQYDARLFDGATLLAVWRVHPMMIIRGQVVRNPYYIPAEEYLKRSLLRPR